MPYLTTSFSLKWFLLPFLLVAPESVNRVQEKAVLSHYKTEIDYSKYNQLTNDIPSSKELINLNKKMDDLSYRVENLERSLNEKN